MRKVEERREREDNPSGVSPPSQTGEGGGGGKEKRHFSFRLRWTGEGNHRNRQCIFLFYGSLGLEKALMKSYFCIRAVFIKWRVNLEKSVPDANGSRKKARGEELKPCLVLYSQPFRQKGPKNNPPTPFGKSRFEREDTRTKFLFFSWRTLGKLRPQ